jgi:hypothetical protein
VESREEEGQRQQCGINMQQNAQEGREERGKVQTCENLAKSDIVRLRYYHDIAGKNSSTYLVNKYISHPQPHHHG